MRRATAIVGLTMTAACAGAARPVDASRSGMRPEPPAVAGREEMILVTAGTFIRGRTGGRPDEGPPHTVRLRAFYIDATLVTRAAFARFAQATGYATTAERMGYGMGSEEGMDDWAWQRVPHGSWRRPFVRETADAAAFLRDDAPVVMVTFADAVAFCAHAGKRLPTEAEWEYAMRAGSSGTRYPWGDSAEREPGKVGLNYWQGESHHANTREDGHVYVSPVRAFPPNAWGIYDPVGNVWQWTSDFYAADTYARTSARAIVDDPRGPEAGTERVLRGGSWWCGSCTCEGNGLFYRGHASPTAPFNNNGFRCARDAEATSDLRRP